MKRGPGGETIYVSEYMQVQNQNTGTKHVFIGDTRVASKLFHAGNGTYNQNYEERNVYYYHSDHLGSSNFVTDFEAREFEHFEYTPYGETWVEEGNGKDVIGYRFTSKELDTETGLYYFGARYYDPLTSRWASPDPAGEKLIDEWVNQKKNKNGKQSPGFREDPPVTNWYEYGNNNPVLYVDEDGNVSAVAGAIAGATWGAASTFANDLINGEWSSWETYAGNIVGGAVGGAVGASGGLLAALATAAATSQVVTNGLLAWQGKPTPSLGDVALQFGIDTVQGVAAGKIAGFVVPRGPGREPIKFKASLFGKVGRKTLWLQGSVENASMLVGQRIGDDIVKQIKEQKIDIIKINNTEYKIQEKDKQYYLVPATK